MTRPSGPTSLAAIRLSMPAPEPISMTWAPAGIVTEAEGIAGAGKGLDGAFGDALEKRIVVLENAWPVLRACVKVKALVGVLGDLSVLVLDFTTQNFYVYVRDRWGSCHRVRSP